MRISVINTLPIPSGHASVNRVLSYTKGLVLAGNEVSILSSGKSASAPAGEMDGVKYVNYGTKGGSLIVLFHILSDIQRNKYDVVVIISNSLLLIYPVWLVCKLQHIRFVQEKSEFPFVLMKKGLLNYVWARFYVNTTYKLFDGMIIMTRPLMDYFRSKVRKNCQLFQMPMTVDTDRFAMERTVSQYGDYIAYCGNMEGNKDGVLNLIDAFNMASSKIPYVKLLLIGGSSNQDDWGRIVATVKDTGNENIILYGKASREDMPLLLKNARALALARPSSLQSTGGFPTKLGEYLATGNPVVVTAVGDIPQYLNESNAFVVEPDNNSAFAEALIKLFADYEKAKEVGLRGLKLSQTVFSAKVQSQRLCEYLKTICE